VEDDGYRTRVRDLNKGRCSIRLRESGKVHDYFRPYENAYDTYLYYMNALSDLQLKVAEDQLTR